MLSDFAKFSHMTRLFVKGCYGVSLYDSVDSQTRQNSLTVLNRVWDHEATQPFVQSEILRLQIQPSPPGSVRAIPYSHTMWKATKGNTRGAYPILEQNLKDLLSLQAC